VFIHVYFYTITFLLAIVTFVFLVEGRNTFSEWENAHLVEVNNGNIT